MDYISRLISKRLFVNAYQIIDEYLQKSVVIHDVNLRLLKPCISQLTKAKVEYYYDRYIEKDRFYLIPELFASDTVTIPKNLTSVREYRFMSTYAYILYNAIGLLFVECCQPLIEELDFRRKGIYVYCPTRFRSENSSWIAKNDYRSEYSMFNQRFEDSVVSGDVVLGLDISDYFGTMKHSILSKILLRYAKDSILSKNNVNRESVSLIEFYFRSLMDHETSIPQGKKNFLSDYLGNLYLLPLDIKVSHLTQSEVLDFKAMTRYVDDIFLVFTPLVGTSKKRIHRELLRIEQRLSSFILEELGLKTNANKVERQIVSTKKTRLALIERIKKRVSPAEEKPNETAQSAMQKRFESFREVIGKFQFQETNSFDLVLLKPEREALKDVFDGRFVSYLFKSEVKNNLLTILSRIDIELTADYINLLIPLFFAERKGKQPFEKPLSEKLRGALPFFDKRAIHVLSMAIADQSKVEKYYQIVGKIADCIDNDDYGKYVFVNMAKFVDASFDPIRKTPTLYVNKEYNVFNRIVNEFMERKPVHGLSVFEEERTYIRFLQQLFKLDLRENAAVLQQLKYYVNGLIRGEYHVAFNYFHNAFHEICKVAFRMDDHCTIKDIINRLHKSSLLAGMEEEMLLVKFYDRRNFNIISHPSQKGAPAVMVGVQELEYYAESILSLLVKILKNMAIKQSA